MQFKLVMSVFPLSKKHTFSVVLLQREFLFRLLYEESFHRMQPVLSSVLYMKTPLQLTNKFTSHVNKENLSSTKFDI